MHCTNCGSALPEGAAFCPGCETRAGTAGPTAMMPARKLDGYSILGLAGGGLALLFVLALDGGGGGSNAANSATSPAAYYSAERIRECQRVITLARQSGLVMTRPTERRIEVDEAVWNSLVADSKRALLQAVFCVAFRGQPDTLDNVVVDGYYSGKRLAVASDTGVNFE